MKHEHAFVELAREWVCSVVWWSPERFQKWAVPYRNILASPRMFNLVILSPLMRQNVLFNCFLFSTLYVLSLLHNEIVMTSNYKRNVSRLTFKRATLEIVCESESKLWPSMVSYTWNLCSAYKPSKCTHKVETRAVGSQFCGARGAVGGSVPCSKVSLQLYLGWRERCLFTPPPTIPAGPETRTCDLRVTSMTLYPLGHNCPTLLCCYRPLCCIFPHGIQK